jgi:hypothetical protein
MLDLKREEGKSRGGGLTWPDRALFLASKRPLPCVVPVLGASEAGAHRIKCLGQHLRGESQRIYLLLSVVLYR